MAQTLASLQLGVEATFKRVSDTRKLLTEVVEFFCSLYISRLERNSP